MVSKITFGTFDNKRIIFLLKLIQDSDFFTFSSIINLDIAPDNVKDMP